MSKRLVLSSVALLALASGSSTPAAEQNVTSPASDSTVKPTTRTVNIPVKGMACREMCGTRVTKALTAIDGVERVLVSAAEGNARVTYIEAKVTPERLAAAVNKLGFEGGAPNVEK